MFWIAHKGLLWHGSGGFARGVHSKITISPTTVRETARVDTAPVQEMRSKRVDTAPSKSEQCGRLWASRELSLVCCFHSNGYADVTRHPPHAKHSTHPHECGRCSSHSAALQRRLWSRARPPHLLCAPLVTRLARRGPPAERKAEGQCPPASALNCCRVQAAQGSAAVGDGLRD